MLSEPAHGLSGFGRDFFGNSHNQPDAGVLWISLVLERDICCSTTRMAKFGAEPWHATTVVRQGRPLALVEAGQGHPCGGLAVPQEAGRVTPLGPRQADESRLIPPCRSIDTLPYWPSILRNSVRAGSWRSCSTATATGFGRSAARGCRPARRPACPTGFLTTSGGRRFATSSGPASHGPPRWRWSGTRRSRSTGDTPLSTRGCYARLPRRSTVPRAQFRAQ